MLMRKVTSTAVILGLISWCISFNALAELTAPEIVTKARNVKGGDDTISRLTFTFHKPDGSEKKVVYTMAWKDYGGKDDVDHKVIFFNEYPPDDNGKSYMIWIYDNRQDDEWMYLPELRMVRKVTHDESHHHNDKEDVFANSVLTQVNLLPRDPNLDDHKLLGEDEVNGHTDYVVESVPKQANKNFPYQKTRRWIAKDNFLTERIDYYDDTGNVLLRQTTKWKKIGDAWVWEQVVGVNPKNDARTVLDISDIRVNNGLKDEAFSARTMRLGEDSIMQ